MKTNSKNSKLFFKKIIVIIFGISFIPHITYSQAYVPPIGIPAPEFGINETVENVYGSDNYYTHYIDNSDTNATDTGNPNGSYELPRLTIPTNLSAGSVVEIHGGPYNSLNTTFTMNGTIDEPVLIVIELEGDLDVGGIGYDPRG